ncbi:MAG TPA: polymer-forming cytoskeletal protein, partial [Thermoanaerobaculia bacterium]|nr:polymer-forming cytoskeletal protein [Thermoanaerobaculia bacterium]
MRAWRFESWYRIARDLMSPRSLVAILVLVAALGVPLSLGWAQTKTTLPKTPATSDSASSDESGFNVRVREEGAGASARIREKVDRAIERAQRDASKASAAAERAAGNIPQPPEPPEPPDFDHSEGNDLVRFGEDITIPENRVIEGDVVAVGGSITVLGRVKGDAVSVGGTVHVKGKGVVEGDAVSLGGGVQTSDSASVGGSDVSVGKFDFDHMNHLWPMIGAMGMLSTGAWIVKMLVGLLITLFLGWISLLLVRERLEYAAGVVHERFGRSFVMGLLGWVLLVLAIPVGIIALVLTGVIAIVILCITIIGIPVAILLVVALVLGVIGIVVGALYAGFLGYLTGTMFLGRRILGQRVATKPLLAIAAGVLLIGVLRFAGELIGALSFFAFHPVGMAFGFAAALLC